jgi:high-affinity nickel permease
VFSPLTSALDDASPHQGRFVVGVFITSWILSYLIFRWRGFGRVVVERT